MNLRNLAGAAVRRINPDVPITIQVSTGYTTAADGTQTPSYSPVNTTGNMQPLSGQDLKRIQNLNAQEVTAKVFVNGNYEGVVRNSGIGGDLLTINGQTYLITVVIERWPDWCLVGVTEQIT